MTQREHNHKHRFDPHDYGTKVKMQFFGAAKMASLPRQAHGFVYFTTEPIKDDDTFKRIAHYKPPHIGKGVILTPEQEKHIAAYLGLTVEDLIDKKCDEDKVDKVNKEEHECEDPASA